MKKLYLIWNDQDCEIMQNLSVLFTRIGKRVKNSLIWLTPGGNHT